MASMDDWGVEELFNTLRRAAPFAELSRSVFDGVLDMLSGRYPSDDFAELRPRITWDRAGGFVRGREGAKRVAIANGGTIPDRGLYGVFLSGSSPDRSSRGAPGPVPAGAAGERGARVGELDEEMVFESRVGETFVLGASTWRIEEITHDRVLVSPAPGEPGKMPFWKGDRAGRPLELGVAIGRLTRNLLRIPPPAAIVRLTREHDLTTEAAEGLLQYLRDQHAASGAVPDEATIVVERVRDELGDWRVCLLSPRGGPIHAPWAMAAAARIRDQRGLDVETLWGDDGFVVRFPDADRPPEPALLFPEPEQVQGLVIRQLGATALFAGKFRENAARSLLLPKRRPGTRAPLWQQRKRAADLLAVASRYGSFPMLLETYRECLRDYFDLPALTATLSDVQNGKIRIVTLDSSRPSPFAASLLFNYVASFLYDGDAPLAERRAQALSVDQSQLRDLIGDAELRELLDPASLYAVERQLQRLDLPYQARTVDGLHDLLLRLGDLSDAELRERAVSDPAVGIRALVEEQRALAVCIAGDERYIAIEDASRYKDGLGIAIPSSLPQSLLDPVADPLGDIARRYARTHAPFTAAEFSGRYGLSNESAEELLARLAEEGRLLEGEFRPRGTGREWTDAQVLRMVRRRSLAKLRQEIEPVDAEVLGRFVTTWQGVARPRRGPDAILDAIEQLQGAPLPASIVETEILPARVEGYDTAELDALMAAGVVVWVGVEPLGERDGRIAFYLGDHLASLLPPSSPPKPARAKEHVGTAGDALDSREAAILDLLRSRGASFFGPLHEAAGGGYPGATVDALWSLAWRGLVTNDTFHVVRSFTSSPPPRQHGRPHEPAHPVRSRHVAPPSAEGRWSLVRDPMSSSDVTTWATVMTEQLLARHGVVTRESISPESLPGGFATIYPVLRAMEERGRLRRGYFVAGLGSAQFALPAALDLLRSLRDQRGDGAATPVLAATDPANPYGSTLRWPAAMGALDQTGSAHRGPARAVGATVVLVNGALAAYLARGDRSMITWLPDGEPERSQTALAVARVLIERARSGGDKPRGMLIEEIDGVPPAAHPIAPSLVESGFAAGALGLQATFLRHGRS
jgi:ATP-dependent Lhr-like helicase